MLESTPFDIPGGQGAESPLPDGAHDGAPLRTLDWADLSARFAAARDLRRVLPSARSGADAATASFRRLAAANHAAGAQTVNAAARTINQSASANGKPAAPNPMAPDRCIAVAGSTTTFDEEGGRDR
ncbi:MAG: hypothetical protein WA954_09150 [Parerythrobacter sp.]